MHGQYVGTRQQVIEPLGALDPECLEVLVLDIGIVRDEVHAECAGAELTAYPTDHLQLYAGYGYTDSRITKMADPTVLGNQAPLVSRDTVNAGAMYLHTLADGLKGTARLDFQNIGRTWWDPADSTSRDPISLVNLDLSLQGTQWTLTAWSKNLTNKIYNAEFSPGGFLWRALPRRYGLDFEYRF